MIKRNNYLIISFVILITLLSGCGGGSGGSSGGNTGDPVGSQGTGIIPDTGQSACYYDATLDGFYNPAAYTCLEPGSAWGPDGQDGYYATNTMSFTDNGNGTVLDNISGLTWQKCTLGESGNDCGTGTAASLTWNEAISACTNLNLDGTGWRLPDVYELTQLVDYGSSYSSIDITVFPGTNPAPYWTSSVHSTQAWAWYVSFSQGITWANNQTQTYKVRCVRG